MTMLIDLDDVVHQWAWDLYGKTADRKQKSLRKKDAKNNSTYISLVIDWSRCRFADETEWLNLQEKDAEYEGVGGKTPQVEGGIVIKVKPSKSISSEASVLFQTKFVNNTEDFQEYTLRTEKSTTSTCSIQIETGFTHGFELGVTLSCPGDILSANAGYSRQYSLTNTKGQTFEEQLNWGVESTIKVKAQHIAEAQLIIKEKRQSGRFKITTTVSGRVLVTFTNIRDNNSYVKAVSGDMTDVIQKYIDIQLRKGQIMDFVQVNTSKSPSEVIIVTKGESTFHFGIHQEVRIDQRRLGEEVMSPKNK